MGIDFVGGQEDNAAMAFYRRRKQESRWEACPRSEAMNWVSALCGREKGHPASAPYPSRPSAGTCDVSWSHFPVLEPISDLHSGEIGAAGRHGLCCNASPTYYYYHALDHVDDESMIVECI